MTRLDLGRDLIRCLGVTAAAVFALAASSQQRAEALSLASPGTAPLAKFATDGLTIQVQAPGGGFRGGGGGGFRGGAPGGFRGGVPGGFRGGGAAFRGGGGFRGGRVAIHRGGGFRAGPGFRGGGFRAAPVFHGGRHRFVHRHAFHRPHVFHRPRFHHRRFFHRRFYAPAFYAPAFYTYPRYYAYPRRYCRVIWTYYGPRRICRYRPWHRPYVSVHFGFPFHYW